MCKADTHTARAPARLDEKTGRGGPPATSDGKPAVGISERCNALIYGYVDNVVMSCS
jgi:hypothetical protein